LKPEDATYLQTYAQGLINEYGKNLTNLEILKAWEHQKWELESGEISKNFIYASIKPGDTITRAFQDKSYEIIRQRIFQGGQRLASTILGMYDSYTKHSNSTVSETEEKVIKRKYESSLRFLN